VWRIAKCSDDGLRQLAWLQAGRLRRHQRHVAGEIAVLRVAGGLHADLLRHAVRRKPAVVDERFERLAKQLGEMLLHAVSCG
jgi:hypothetical protein